MDLSDLISPTSIVPALKAQSKKQVLQELCARAARQTGLSEREIFDTILQREKLGSTGVGHGVAIPHGKLHAIDTITGQFARLSRPVDFDALDDQPVDLVFLLLAPESAGADHLKALARIILTGLLGARVSCAYLAWGVLGWEIEWIYAALIPDYAVKAVLFVWYFRKGRWKTAIPQEELMRT